MPFALEPPHSALGPSTNTPTAINILKSDIPSEWTDDLSEHWLPKTITLLKEIKSSTAQPINIEITMLEFKKNPNNWKERTTTSPSGIHLGHLKALLAPQADNSAEHKIVTEMSKLTLKMLNITTEFGYVPERWLKIVSFMIEKDPDRPSITHLWVIYIYEADLNMFLKLLWAKKLSAHAEQHDLFLEQQWGFCMHPGAVDVALCKVLVYKNCRMQILTVVISDLDAIACFD